jgi:hypothetical protein
MAKGIRHSGKPRHKGNRPPSSMISFHFDESQKLPMDGEPREGASFPAMSTEGLIKVLDETGACARF